MSPEHSTVIPSVPPLETVLAAIAELINDWGRGAVDPSLPAVDPDADGQRSVRYAVQALRETADSKTSQAFRDLDNEPAWWGTVRRPLADAEAALRMSVIKQDPQDLVLQWYIAYLHLDRARAIWTECSSQPTADQTQDA